MDYKDGQIDGKEAKSKFRSNIRNLTSFFEYVLEMPINSDSPITNQSIEIYAYQKGGRLHIDGRDYVC